MRFARAEYLWLLLLVPAIAAALGLARARRRRYLARFADLALVDKLVRTGGPHVGVIKIVLVSLAATFLVLAAARPQWGSTLEQVSRKGVDLLIGIDISESMLAEDVKPNRLQKAREESSRLLDRLQGDRVGLIAFAGSAGVLCPLTLDYTAVRIFLDVLAPDLISYPGTSIAEAIKRGMETFSAEERKFKVMLLFSDGEDQLDAAGVEAAARVAAEQGIVIHTVGVGTASGAPIPVRGPDGAIEGYKQDAGGRVVTSRLEETILARVSEITGGQHYAATAAETELDRVAEAIAAMDKKDLQARLMTQYEERFQIPLGAALAALLADALLTGRRRRGAIRPGEQPAGQPEGRAA